MRRVLAAAALGAAVVLAVPAFADEHFPEPTGFVTDVARAVPDDVQQAVEQRLSAFEQQAGYEVAIAVVDSTGSDAIEDYANDMFKEWGIGKEDENNGVLLLIAIGDRRLRIEVGIGADDELTDLESGEIVRDLLVPRLRAGDVGGAVQDGAAAIVQQLGGDGGSPPPAVQPAARGGGFPGWLPLVLIIGTFVLFGALSRGGASRVQRAGRGGQPGEADWVTPLIFGLLLGSRGRGGGGDWSGGGGGGGFGGFGGGDSGGGGASGSW